MQSVLLIGQSNMSGRGDLSEVAKIYDERIFMLRDEGWVTMQEPIHTAGRAGAGIGASFAKAFVETFNCELGLIPAAVGGTSLEEWSVDGYTDANGDKMPYDDSIRDDFASGVWASHTKVNLNPIKPPKYIKVFNNTQGIVISLDRTDNLGSADGGGFFGETKFYYAPDKFYTGTGEAKADDDNVFVFH
jgi:hypothetical protein